MKELDEYRAALENADHAREHQRQLDIALAAAEQRARDASALVVETRRALEIARSELNGALRASANKTVRDDVAG